MKTYEVVRTAAGVLGFVLAGLLTGGPLVGASAQTLREDGVRIDLRSDYIPTPARLETSEGTVELRSVIVRGELTDGAGVGSVILDNRLATLNEFGDPTGRIGPAPKELPTILRRITLEELRELDPYGEDLKLESSPKLYEISFPGKEITSTMHLKMGSVQFGPHRLLVYKTRPAVNRRSHSDVPQVVTLTGEPSIPPAFPDEPWAKSVKLSGTYNALDGIFRRIVLEGRLGGEGKLTLDPNYITLGPFGEARGWTLMGFRAHDVVIRPVDITDPLGLDRRLYELASANAANTNRCFLALGKTEAASHRLLLYKGDNLRLLVPATQPERARHEKAQEELDRVSPLEQRSIADLRQSIGYDFRYDVTDGRVTGLNVLGEVELNRMDAPLIGLPHLETVSLHGHLALPGLASLAQLSELKTVIFSGVRAETEAFAFLEHLDQIESLRFYACRAVNDSVVSYISGAANLRSLSVYDELRPGEALGDIPHVTDRGLAHLSKLRGLESLSVFGEGITDASIPLFEGFRNLTDLQLHRTGLTLTGLVEFAGRSHVGHIRASWFHPSSDTGADGMSLEVQEQSVVLEGKVTNEAIRALAAWSGITRLRLDAMSHVTDDGLRPLSALTNLEYLAIHNGHALTNDGLEHLTELTGLRELSLFACRKISDAGLEQLHPLRALEKLNLGQTRATDRGVARLQEQLPKCEIKR